ncbi:MAG: GDP-mannose 4,6-dehydratase [Candidatus Omnitrophica bacterium]|nr:GDP-mannose 4,6-dehydratase [Candidatus Omnitrophota bacterium]
MNWTGKRVLVTGAGGFIGSHLTERLVALGARTRALVFYRSNGSWGWLDDSNCKQDVEVVSGDIRDRDSVKRAVQGVEYVFHLAALIAIPYSYTVPESFIRTNVDGSLNVLQAAREEDVRCVIHTSTSEAYGSARRVPICEDHPLQAQSPYAASKIAADKLAESFYLSYGTPVVTLRPFNTFGPRQSGRSVLPTIISQCLTQQKLVLGSLHPTRDFNYVENIVDGFVKAAETPRAVGRTINLGSGMELRIQEAVDVITRIIGKEMVVERSDERVRPESSEVVRLIADNSAAHEILGWKPLISFEEGLRRTIEWMEEHLDVYRAGAYVL